MTDIQTVVGSILTGTLDDELETLREAIKTRKKTLSQQKFLLTKVGATGRLVNLRPKYLVGAPVTVLGRKQTRLEVEIDANFPTGRYGRKITVTPDMIELD